MEDVDKIGANKITSVKEKKGTNVKMNNDNNGKVTDDSKCTDTYKE